MLELIFLYANCNAQYSTMTNIKRQNIFYLIKDRYFVSTLNLSHRNSLSDLKMRTPKSWGVTALLSFNNPDTHSPSPNPTTQFGNGQNA